jgi:hypothetical protein
MREAWAELTFKDEAGASPLRERHAVVAPAARSAAALDKVRNRRLPDGTAPMSFRGLLEHLSTIVRNTMQPSGARPGEATFTLATRPSPKQSQALDLLANIVV